MVSSLPLRFGIPLAEKISKFLLIIYCMDVFVRSLSVFGLGIVDIWAAVPLGFVLRLPPALTGSLSAAGAVVGVVIVELLGEKISTWFQRRYKQPEKGQQGRIRRLWQRYGVVGLGVLSPLVATAWLGTILGLVLRVPSNRLLLWVSIGIIIWSTVFTLAGVLGLTIIGWR